MMEDGGRQRESTDDHLRMTNLSSEKVRGKLESEVGSEVGNGDLAYGVSK